MTTPEIRERYLQDAPPVRLGGLAADLARVVSFSQDTCSAPVVASLLDESRFFIEWVAPDLVATAVDDAARLVEIQRSLTDWYLRWNQAQTDTLQCQALAQQAQAWSDEILAMSGLLADE